MLTPVFFLKILARLVLIAGVSGATPPLFPPPDGTAPEALRANRPAAAVALIRTLQTPEGLVFTKDGGRAHGTGGRRTHVHPGMPAAAAGILPPQTTGPSIAQTSASSRFTSRTSASLRGPPAAI
jgi:hypothetical protein